MHVLVHDFAGHPFQAELSRELGRRGHRVSHAWFAGDIGPKGVLTKLEGDPEFLAFLPFGQQINYSKTNFFRRRSGDVRYGREVADWIVSNRPDIVMSGNTPTEAQEAITAACCMAGVPFVYWCQDFYSIAASRLLEKKLPGIGKLIGAYYRRLERRQMHRSARVLHITEAFCDQTDAWGISRDKVDVIPNWGALDMIDLGGRDNSWSRMQNLKPGTRFLYSGTLAMKHNPRLLIRLAEALEGDDEVILVSAGTGADTLSKLQSSRAVERMRLLPLQPFEVFADVLASGDVLLAVIEREAGMYSVPSKILSYLCAGRPIVLAAPADNLAAKIVSSCNAGHVVEPEDVEGFARAALEFRNNPVRAAEAGQAGRAYAEKNFHLGRVAERFEMLFQAAREAR